MVMIKFNYLIRGVDKILQVNISYWNSLVLAKKCWYVTRLVIFWLKNRFFQVNKQLYLPNLPNYYLSVCLAYIIFSEAKL